MQPKISAIIFDMDGLMLDTERIAQQAWRAAGAEWDYTLPDAVYLSVVGRTVRDTEASFLEAFGPEFPFRAMYDRKQEITDDLIAQHGIPTKPGLWELLEQIESLGLAKAVATSTARPRATQKLTLTRLIDRFPFIVCGNEIPRGKPAPDIFLSAAEKLNVSPQHCLVLEDSEAGIKAAHAAGMTPVMVPDMKQPSPEIQTLAFRVLDSLHAVRPLLHDVQVVTSDYTDGKSK